MAKGRANARRRSVRDGARRVRAARQRVAGGVDASVIPRVLVGAVDGVEIVAGGALQLAREVLLRTVSGAANIGAEALAATTAGARGVVSAASQMVGDIASAAAGTFQDAVSNARHARVGRARATLRRPAAGFAGGGGNGTTAAASTDAGRPARRARGRRGPLHRPARASPRETGAIETPRAVGVWIRRVSGGGFRGVHELRAPRSLMT
jgi:hypothetical protein